MPSSRQHTGIFILLSNCTGVVFIEIDDIVDTALDKGIGNKSQHEERQYQIQEAGIVVHTHTALFFGLGKAFAHFVHPVKRVDAAGYKAVENHHAAGGRGLSSGYFVDIIGYGVHPVNSIDTAGNKG